MRHETTSLEDRKMLEAALKVIDEVLDAATRDDEGKVDIGMDRDEFADKVIRQVLAVLDITR